MDVFVTKTFRRFQRRERIGDAALSDAVRRAMQGLVDADLGGGLIKQRVARAGQGRSRGYRTIFAFRSGSRAIFLFGFAKSDIANVPSAELAALRIIGARLLLATAAQIEMALASGELVEIEHVES